MKEKIYKKMYDAITKQKEGEVCVHEKKGYVNIKSFPPYRDIFAYHPIEGYVCGLIGALVGSILLSTLGALIGGLGVMTFHWYHTYGRFK